MPSHRTNLQRWIERLLWITAAATLGFSVFVVGEGRIYQLYLNLEFNDAIKSHREGALTFEDTVHTTDPLSPESASAKPDPWPYIGRVEIPRLDMSIMLLEGIDNRTLRRGIGHIPGTALPGETGNVGIAGHRDGFFRGLGAIRKHDRITVQTVDASYRYEVDSIRVVDPGAIEVLNDTGHPVLTLVTCYPFHLVGPAPKRFVVQASLSK